MVKATDIKKDVPGLVKAISVFYYILSISAIIGGILFIAGFSSLYFYLFLIVTLFLGIIFSFLVILSSVPIAFLITGIFLFFVARGIWKGRNWARISIIIVSALLIIYAMAYVLTAIPGITISVSPIHIINLFIIFYLLFSKRVKEAFS